MDLFHYIINIFRNIFIFRSFSKLFSNSKQTNRNMKFSFGHGHASVMNKQPVNKERFGGDISIQETNKTKTVKCSVSNKRESKTSLITDPISYISCKENVVGNFMRNQLLSSENILKLQKMYLENSNIKSNLGKMTKNDLEKKKLKTGLQNVMSKGKEFGKSKMTVNNPNAVKDFHANNMKDNLAQISKSKLKEKIQKTKQLAATKNQISAFKELDKQNQLTNLELSSRSTEALPAGYKPNLNFDTSADSSEQDKSTKHAKVNLKPTSSSGESKDVIANNLKNASKDSTDSSNHKKKIGSKGKDNEPDNNISSNSDENIVTPVSRQVKGNKLKPENTKNTLKDTVTDKSNDTTKTNEKGKKVTNTAEELKKHKVVEKNKRETSETDEWIAKLNKNDKITSNKKDNKKEMATSGESSEQTSSGAIPKITVQKEEDDKKLAKRDKDLKTNNKDVMKEGHKKDKTNAKDFLDTPNNIGKMKTLDENKKKKKVKDEATSVHLNKDIKKTDKNKMGVNNDTDKEKSNKGSTVKLGEDDPALDNKSIVIPEGQITNEEILDLLCSQMKYFKNLSIGTHCRTCGLLHTTCCNCGCFMDEDRVPIGHDSIFKPFSNKCYCSPFTKGRSMTVCRPNVTWNCKNMCRYSTTSSESFTLSRNCILNNGTYKYGNPQKVICISR